VPPRLVPPLVRERYEYAFDDGVISTLPEYIVRILLLALDGVMLAVVTVVELEVVTSTVVTTCTTCNTVPEDLLVKMLPVTAGSVNVLVPDTSGADRVIAPLVFPAMTIELIYFLLLN